jgi:TP901 family phage tail tape measure protein
MSSKLHANLSIAIQTIGAQKLDVLRKGLGSTAQSALALAKTYDKLSAAERKLQRFQKAAAQPGMFARGFDKTANVVAGAAKGFDGLLTIGSKLFLTSQLISSGFRAIGGAVSTAIEPLKDFQSAMAQVQIKGGFDGAATKRLADQAKELGRTTAFGPTQAAQAQVALAASGLTEQQIAMNTPTVLKFAQASGMGADESSDYLVNVARQFQLDLNDPNTLRNVGSAIKNAADASTISERDLQQTLKYAGPIAKAAGYGVSEAVAMAAIMGNSGLKGSQSGTGLRNLFSSFAKPKGGDVTAELLDEIGLTKQDLNKNIENIPNFLELMEDRMLAKGFDKGKRIALAASLFGQYGMTAAMVLQKAAGSSADVLVNGIDAMVKAVNGNLNSLDTAADIRGATLEGRLDSMSARWETLRITVAEAVLPQVITAIETITAKITEWEQKATTDPVWIENIAAGGRAIENLIKLMEMLVTIAKPFFDLVANIGRVTAPVGEWFDDMHGEQKPEDRRARLQDYYDALNGKTKKDYSGNVSMPEDGGVSMPELPGISEDLGYTPPEGYPSMPTLPSIPTTDEIMSTMAPIFEQQALMSSEPSALDIHVTTDSGAKATVTRIKKGAVEPRVSTNAAP